MLSPDDGVFQSPGFEPVSRHPPVVVVVDALLNKDVVCSVYHGNKKAAFCSDFAKPSDGLEPSTASLPWRFRGGNRGHDRASAATFFLQIGSSGRVNDART